MADLCVEKISAQVISLQELSNALQSGLAQNFRSSSVSVENCPDLRQAPYNLAFAGLCGSPRIADVGGQPNLAPSPDFTKKYDLLNIARIMEMSQEQGTLLGAAAGPFHIVGMNSELMPNLQWENGKITNKTYFAKVKDDGSAHCEMLGSHDCALMANLFGSSGERGDVLHITASFRTGNLNFTEAIRKALRDAYGTSTVSLGGVFVISKGKAQLHVMPDFSPTPLITDEQKQKWLRFYEMKAPLVCLCVLHSHDPGLDLRIEHTHCFSEHGEGGHYHYDTTPEEVQYEAWFNVAEVLYRIDKPQTEAMTL